MSEFIEASLGGKLMPAQRVPTGIPGLDEVTYGGFLEGDSVLVAGSPGSGKSTLGMQFIYEGIVRYNEPGFFITFEEFPQQIYRDALNYGWDFRALEEEDKLKVLFTSPDLMFQDIKRQEGIFPEMIREIGAKRVVVDSITHFQRLADDENEWREIIYSLTNALKREGLTPMLVRELVRGEAPGTVAEEYTADTVLHLTMDRVKGQRLRFIEVLKSRGSRHVPAKCLFFLHENGLEVIPAYQEAFFRYHEAISTGVPEMDTLMGGGIPYDAFYLFEVSPEIHQEIFEVNFIHETLQAGDLYLELGTSGTREEKLQQLALSYGVQETIKEGLKSGDIHLINLMDDTNSEYDEQDDDYDRQKQALARAIEELDAAFQQTSKTRRGRLLFDVTRLLTTVDEEMFFSLVLTPLLDMVRKYDAVCVGFLNPQAVPVSAREKLSTEADGIVRMWNEATYKYVQVVKTVNSVLTPVYNIVETNSPPYVRLLQY